MKRIWAPWRMKYIQTKNIGCIFCDLQKQADGPESLIVHRGHHAFVILNRFPYTSGHIMVVANVHLPSLEDLDKKTRSEMMELTASCMKVLRSVYLPEAFNIGANIGQAAGAGVVDHVHLHIVPRWGGDTNFMGTIGETRVLPESLDETYHKILERWTILENVRPGKKR